MTPKLISLEAWARATYGEGGPNAATLRRWAREARISPRPQKHGRTYYVTADAKYVAPARTGRLVRRMKHDAAA